MLAAMLRAQVRRLAACNPHVSLFVLSACVNKLRPSSASGAHRVFDVSVEHAQPRNSPPIGDKERACVSETEA